MAVTWVAIVVATPLALAHGYILLPTVVYEAAGLICHQRPERSFHLAGIQLPVCARCLGLYASGAAGAVAACLAGLRGSSRAPSPRAPLVLALAALPTGVTVGLEWADVLHPVGVARALAALPLGALAGWLVVRALAARGSSIRPAVQVRYHS
jgi:hypothetical protein